MNISVKEARQIKTVTLTDCMVTLDEFIAVVKFGCQAGVLPADDRRGERQPRPAG